MKVTLQSYRTKHTKRGIITVEDLARLLASEIPVGKGTLTFSVETYSYDLGLEKIELGEDRPVHFEITWEEEGG